MTERKLREFLSKLRKEREPAARLDRLGYAVWNLHDRVGLSNLKLDDLVRFWAIGREVFAVVHALDDDDSVPYDILCQWWSDNIEDFMKAWLLGYFGEPKVSDISLIPNPEEKPTYTTVESFDKNPRQQ